LSNIGYYAKDVVDYMMTVVGQLFKKWKIVAVHNY